MNKLFYIALTFVLVAVFAACDPIVDVQGVGTIITSADQIQATVTPVMDGTLKTNKVKVHCTSPVLCQWTDGVKNYISNDTVMTLFVTGSINVKLTAMAADGTLLTKNFTAAVDEMKYPVAPQYGYFCGSGTKTWTWADAACFGNGGGSDTKPAWWVLNPADLASQYSGKNLPADGLGATMQFTLNGLSMTKTSVGGATAAGIFSFDMTAGKAGWSIGTITFLNTNILGGYDFNATGYTAWSTYNIISLDANKMVLGAQEHAPNSNYWYWVFKAL
jgi:hypothetical protein